MKNYLIKLIFFRIFAVIMAIQRKKKICKECNQESYIFSNGRCTSCYRKRRVKKVKNPRIYNQGVFKSAKDIKKKIFAKKSARRIQEERKYQRVRKTFLQKNPNCAVRLPGCQYLASEVHHSEGRENDLLIQVETFVPICRICHMAIHSSHTAWARENGFLKGKFNKRRKIKEELQKIINDIENGTTTENDESHE